MTVHRSQTLVILRGVPEGEDGQGSSLIAELKGVVSDTLADAAEDEISEISMIQQDLHEDVAEHTWKRMKRRPLVLPVVVEV